MFHCKKIVLIICGRPQDMTVALTKTRRPLTEQDSEESLGIPICKGPLTAIMPKQL